MGKLTTKERIPDKEFALSAKREFPIEDKTHAANAKARATQSYEKGHITKAEEQRIDRAADRKLHGEKPIKEHEQNYWR